MGPPAVWLGERGASRESADLGTSRGGVVEESREALSGEDSSCWGDIPLLKDPSDRAGDVAADIDWRDSFDGEVLHMSPSVDAVVVVVAKGEIGGIEELGL